MKIKIEIDGISTWIRPMTMTKQRIISRINICPLCREEIKVDADIFLLINNYKLFPNIFVHKKCAEVSGWEVILRILKEDFEMAKDAREHNRCWYDYEYLEDHSYCQNM